MFHRKSAGAVVIAVLACILSFSPAFAAMTSTNYQVQWDIVGVGGEDTATSSSYKLRDTLQMYDGSQTTSTTYKERSGYGAGVYDPIVTFSTFAQDRSTQAAATSLSSTTVTVTTTSGFTIGGYMILVQDEGSSQVSGMGKILSKTATTITVDAWTTTGAQTIDGTNDYAYAMSVTSVNFSSLSTGIVSTAAIGWNVTIDVQQGYSVYVMENNDFRTGDAASSITDVADGAVTAGSSEYGGKSSDSTLASSTFDTADTAFTTSLQQVGSRADNSFSSRDFVTIKAAISSAQTSGAYSHTLSFILVGDY